MIIWTEKEIKEEDRAEFIADLKLANKDKSLKDSYFTNPTFISEEGEYDLKSEAKQFGTYKFTITEDGVVLNCNADKISHANYGTYINKNDEPEIIPEPEKEWIEIANSTDSATGKSLIELDNFKAFEKGNNWFILQKVDFTNTNEIKLDIVAGRELNKIGEITITKDGENYTINYASDMNTLPSIEGYETGAKVELHLLSEAKYKVEEEIFTVSSNGLPTFENGSSFKMNKDVFYIYLHFNVVNKTYELVEK